MEGSKPGGFTFSFGCSFGKSVLKESLDFSSPWHFSDVVLVVEGTKFHVHKSTLSMWSPVFKTMFTSQFLESAAREIPLPGKRAGEIKELLEVIYSSWAKPIVTEKNYQFLLQLSDEYQIDRVKKLCSEFLVNKIDVSNCLEFFKLAEQYGLKGVTEKCHQEVRYNSSADLEGSEHFNGFEPEFKVDICMKIIKELERTLQEYVKTCSDLVQKVYKVVYEDFYSNISQVNCTDSLPSLFSGSNVKKAKIGTKMYTNTQHYENPFEHARVHKGLQIKCETTLEKAKISSGCSCNPKDYNTKFFEFSCSLCIKQVQAIPWNREVGGILTAWNSNTNYSILKEPVNKLYALQHREERGFNIFGFPSKLGHA